MRRNYLIVAVVAIMAASGGYFLAMVMNPSGGTVPSATNIAPGPRADDLVGQRRPDFTLTDVQGTMVSADDFEGRVWLVNFWATWCAPCVEEMPMLSRFQHDYADRGVVVVGIALDDAQRAAEFANELGIDYPLLVGKTDVVLTGRRFGNATGMLPFSVLIDAGGIIRWTQLGALSREVLEAQIEALTHD